MADAKRAGTGAGPLQNFRTSEASRSASSNANQVLLKSHPLRSRVDYLLAELRCAVLRARLWESDITAVALALKGGLISPDEALENLHDCGALHLVAPNNWNSEGWAQAARDYHATRKGAA
jgi:hypothetical protein